MTSYNQRDYPSVILGFGQTTIAQEGCFITVLSYIVQKSPIEVNEILKNNDGFANGNWVSWMAAAKALGLNMFKLLEPYNNDKVKEYLSLGKEVCVIVNGAPIGGNQHMVKYVGNHMCFDPWKGAIVATAEYPEPLTVVVFEPYKQTKPVEPTPSVTPAPAQYTKSEHDAAVEYDSLLRELADAKIITSPAREENKAIGVFTLITQTLKNKDVEKEVELREVKQQRDTDMKNATRESELLKTQITHLQDKLRELEEKPDPNTKIAELNSKIEKYQENEGIMQATIEKYKTSTIKQLIFDIREFIKSKKP